MAISPGAKALNQSAHTLADLQRFAQAEPARATEYLQSVEAQLRKAGKAAEADTVKELLGKTGDLVEKVAALKDKLTTIFPESAGDWGKVQLERAGTVGWGEEAKQVPWQFLSGTVKRENDVVSVTTDGGQQLTLRQSPMESIPQQMSNAQLEGFVGEGRVTLQGTLGEDNKTFNVEAFALNTDGKFNTFTFGRVQVTGDKVEVESPRGNVEVKDPDTKRVLASMPRLGVIMPGEPVTKDGKLVHEGKIDIFQAMARFKEPPPASVNGPIASVKANMADNHFVMKPIEFPAEQLQRAAHSSRLWVRGFPEFDAAGEPVKFKADYISLKLDSYSFRTGDAEQSADPVQAAVMQEIV